MYLCDYVCAGVSKQTSDYTNNKRPLCSEIITNSVSLCENNKREKPTSWATIRASSMTSINLRTKSSDSCLPFPRHAGNSSTHLCGAGSTSVCHHLGESFSARVASSRPCVSQSRLSPGIMSGSSQLYNSFYVGGFP